MQLCRWEYGVAGDMQAVEIFVSVEPAAFGRGFGLVVAYQALAFQEGPAILDASGEPRRDRRQELAHDFADQAQAQAETRSGLDPLYGLFARDPEFQRQLKARFAKLAAVYERELVAAAAPAPEGIGKWDARRL